MSDVDDDRALDYVEFETTGEEYWAVEQFRTLAELFAVEKSELADWHEFMSHQGRAWEIIRRLCQVGSLTDADDEVLRTWNRAQIAKEMGIPKGQVDQEIEHAANQWKLKRARSEVVREIDGGPDESDIDKLTSFSDSGGIGKEVVDRLLEAFNFEVRDENLRAQVAKRILSMKDYLASPHTRTSAREIIRMEITMHGLEKILTGYQNQIERLADEDPERRSRGGEIDSLSGKARELDLEIRKIGAEHQKRQTAIGADDIDMTTRKRIFVETVAYIQEQCRIYESEPENLLIDGVFRAGEIDWLIEPLGERPPQYRPDISVRLKEALTPENLWNPEYVPSKISQRVCQELRKVVDTLRSVDEDAPPLPETGDDEDDEDIPLDPRIEEPAPAESSAAPVGVPSFARREEEAVMGVF